MEPEYNRAGECSVTIDCTVRQRMKRFSKGEGEWQLDNDIVALRLTSVEHYCVIA